MKKINKKIFTDDELLEIDNRLNEDSVSYEDFKVEIVSKFTEKDINELDKRASLIGKDKSYLSSEILREFGYFTLKDELLKSGLYDENSDETAEETESFFLTPIGQKESGLPMCVNLRCLENIGEPPFLRFQNDRFKRFNCNWIKIYLDGHIDNYENRKIIFTKQELQELKNWIVLNKKAIEKHYYQEYDSLEVLSKLKLIGNNDKQ